MGRRDPEYLVVGHLTKAHGTRGDLLVSPLTDHPESVFASGVVLRLGQASADQPDTDLPPMRIESLRVVDRGLLVRFGGVEDRTDAERLRGMYLFQSIDRLEPLADGEIFYHQLLGLEAVTVAGDRIGTVHEVYELGPSDLLEVRGDQGVVMIPFVAHVVVEIDVDAGRLVVDPPDGLLDL